MTAKKLLGISKQTFKCFGEDKAMRLASSLAYYAIFSIGPLLFIMLIIAGAIFGEETVKQTLHQQISSLMGEKAGSTIESMMAARKISGSLVTTIIGIVTLVLGATGVFAELQDALNTIWGVKAKPNAGIWAYLRNRFLSMSMVLGLGFLLLISMVLTTVAAAASNMLSGMFHVPQAMVSGLSAVVSFIVVAIFFALLFKFLPDVKVRWKPVWMGAIVTAILFTVGKYFLSMYLGKQATSSSYGAAGSVVVILLWVYYASVIMFLGAEFTQAYANATGEVIQPDEYAVKTDQDASGQPKHRKEGEREEIERVPPGSIAPVATMVAFVIGLGAAFGFRRQR
ncbi:MAG: YihY/virulence factor BrkB family protein [Limisphaerales bacterium]